MIRGRKTTCYLQKPTETSDGMGGVSATWEDVCELQAVLAPITPSEDVLFGKETVEKRYRMWIGYHDIPANKRSELKEKNRIRVGSDYLDILGVRNMGNANRVYELDLQEFA